VRPWYLSLSSKRVGAFHTDWATHYFFEQAAWRAVRRLGDPPDALYGHFLYSGGAAAANIGKRMGIPSFVAVGEGSFWSVRPFGFERARRDFRDITGVVAVSSVLKRGLIRELEIPPEKIEVFPNGVRLDRFYPRPREEMRRKLGFPLDQFLVAFVGSFEPLKGVHRLSEAIEGLEGVAGLFAGIGPSPPSCSNVVFRGPLRHEQIPELLSAADVFVLPTFEEGSCNALVEAMACGLPIVTSDGEFNDDLVDSSLALRVNADDAQGIRRAILRLKNDPSLRREMGAAALRKAQTLDIRKRASSILRWMESMVRP